jgi:glycosyltransferase involved in cell wall biosynthesis
MSGHGSPAVSIIMNCYNSERFLKEAIDSVCQQSYEDWEIVFWDNASTDSSAEIAQSYDDRVKYFLAAETAPLGEARNLALKQAKGKYIAFLDCDDIYLPDKLEKQVALMEQGEYALSYGSAITVDESGREIRRRAVSNKSGNVFAGLLKRYEVNMQSVMVRRDILLAEKLGFDESMKYCPDYNLFMEIASRHMVGVIKDFLVKYRVVANSLSKQTLDIAAPELRYSLDRILSGNPQLKSKYPSEITGAYAKLHYYDAVAAIYQDNRKEARNRLKPAVRHNMAFIFLYLLLYLPIPVSVTLKLLRR